MGGFPDQVAQGAHRRQAFRRAAQHQTGRTAPPPELKLQRRQRPAGQPGQQFQRQPGQIRARRHQGETGRAGPDNRRNAPARARVQAVEEVVQGRAARFRAQIRNAVYPWPAGQRRHRRPAGLQRVVAVRDNAHGDGRQRLAPQMAGQALATVDAAAMQIAVAGLQQA